MRLIFTFLLFSNITVFSQVSVGVRTGMNWHFWDADVHVAALPTTTIYKTSSEQLSISLPVKIELNKWLVFTPVLSYTKRSLRTESNYRTDTLQIYKTPTIYSYMNFMELDLNLRIQPRFKKIQPFVEIGPTLGLRVNDKSYYSLIGQNFVEYTQGPVPFSQKNDFQIGLNTNFGLEIYLTEQFSFNVAGRYYYGLSSVIINQSKFVTPLDLNQFSSIGFYTGINYRFTKTN
jgi:Outer membrane protein beta-barrel domain